jgi:RimJ/RimL family protein N-acetyltransferase
MDHISYANEKAEIGYFIDHEYWGKGYATEALRQFLKLLFKRFKFKRIEGHAFSHNTGSQKVMLKNGLKYEGEKKKAIKKNGKFYNQKFYAITK